MPRRMPARVGGVGQDARTNFRAILCLVQSRAPGAKSAHGSHLRDSAKYRPSVGKRKPPLQFLPVHRISHAREYRCSGERVAMARSSELDKMSYAELGDMEAQIARLKIEKQNAERLELRQKLTDTAKQHGFDIHELFGKGRRGGGGPLR